MNAWDKIVVGSSILSGLFLPVGFFWPIFLVLVFYALVRQDYIPYLRKEGNNVGTNSTGNDESSEV